MLVLNRRPGERLLLDNGVVIHVVRAGRGKVGLGIEAPPGVVIGREEVMDPAEVRRIEALARSGRKGVTGGR